VWFFLVDDFGCAGVVVDNLLVQKFGLNVQGRRELDRRHIYQLFQHPSRLKVAADLMPPQHSMCMIARRGRLWRRSCTLRIVSAFLLG